MKNTKRVILRSLAATPLRVAIVYAGIIGLLYVNWSPLPDWAADAVGFAIQFAASYFLAWWVLHGRSTRWSDGLIVAFTFITVGTMLEVGIGLVLRGPSPELFANMFALQSMLLYSVYLLGALVATWQVRRSTLNAVSQV